MVLPLNTLFLKLLQPKSLGWRFLTAVVSFYSLISPSAIAQIIPDNSLHQESSVVEPDIDSNKLEAKNHQNLPNHKQAIQEEYLADNQLKQAKDFYQQGEYEQAIALLKTAINQAEKTGNILFQSQSLLNLSLIYLKQSNWQETDKNLQQVFQLIDKIDNPRYRNKLTNYTLEIQGELELAVGQPEKALNTWEQSGEIAYRRGDIQAFIQAQVKQIQALQELGMYGEVVEILEDIQPQLETASQDLVTAQAWLTLGKIYSKLGQLESAQASLERALNLAQKYQNTELISSIFLAQGHLAFSQSRSPTRKPNQQNSQALQDTRKYYQKAAAVTNNLSLQINAQLSELNFLVLNDRQNISDDFIRNLTTKINKLPISKSLINQRINFALNLLRLNPTDYKRLILQQLTQADQESEILNYQRGKSEALGSLAKLYQQAQRREEAQALTEKALYLAGLIKAPDLLYQWQWQLGKIYFQENKRTEAISAYSGAVNTLKSLRSDLVGVNSDLEFNFRENVEPVYRELVSILLRPQATPAEISQARDVIEALQLVELDNFFRAACVDAKPVLLDQITDREDPSAAVIYTIVLADRFETILKLPQEKLRHYSIPLDNPRKVERVLARLAQSLTQRNSQETLPLAQQAYDWLIRPIEEDLATSKVKTLVFVLDSPLRNVPTSVLHDGQQYLVEKYAIALSPGLELIEPQAIVQQQLRVLTAGLTQGRAGFPPLRYVVDELNTVRAQVSESEQLLDGNFTSTVFQDKINQLPFPVVHLATHGQFSSQAENTFILTWDDRLDVNQLNSLLSSRDIKRKEPLELLVLSACETLTGDRRAALGLAGVAVRAGARSTLATLWRVNDEATALLMGQFYQELVKQDTPSTKAEALRRAQLVLLNNSRFKRPHFWAPYVLVGNWL